LFSRGATSPAKIAEMLTSDLRGEVSINSLVKVRYGGNQQGVMTYMHFSQILSKIPQI